MKSALEQAAEELYDVCREGRKNKVTVTPMPYMVTVNPSASGRGFTPSQVSVFADGILVGAGGESFPLPEGKHKLEIKAAGYKPQTLTLDVKADQTVTTTLEKQ